MAHSNRTRPAHLFRGQPALGARPGPVAGPGQDPMPICAASRAAAVRDETPILDSTADT